jgi:amino-acid N-acetyltransferase
MSIQIAYRLADKKDLPAIATLLRNNNLPQSDILTSKVDFILAIADTNIIAGCIGVEQYGVDGLLRSFAVEKTYRNQKVGTELFNALLSFGRGKGIETMHLLTTTAEKYFQAKDFLLSNREAAPAAIKATAEFSSLCPAASAYMYKSIVSIYINNKV